MAVNPVNKDVSVAADDTPARRSEFAALDEALYRERVLEARRMAPEEKILLGEELFEYACAITLAGIRHQNPGFTDDECRQELDRRLQLAERLDQIRRSVPEF